MKFQIEIQDSITKAKWWETNDEETCKDEVSIRSWATAIVQRFNDTLRDHEQPRIFTGAVRILATGFTRHQWIKQNLFTLADHRGAFDNVKCICGATARRYGIGRIKRSAQYRAKKWDNCPKEKS